jgi:hypothetical protein
LSPAGSNINCNSKNLTSVASITASNAITANGGITLASSQVFTMNTGSSISANSVSVAVDKIGFLSTVSSNVQTQIDTKAPTSGPSFTGTVTSSGTINANGGISTSSGNDISFNNKNLTNVGSLSTSSITSSGNDISFNNKNLTNVGTVSATSFTATSDRRIKENIVSLPSEYTIDNLKPVSFYNTLSNKNDIGFIAQDVEEVYPFMVNSGGEYKSLNYISIIGILVKEIQDLKKEIRQIKNM